MFANISTPSLYLIIFQHYTSIRTLRRHVLHSTESIRLVDTRLKFISETHFRYKNDRERTCSHLERREHDNDNGAGVGHTVHSCALLLLYLLQHHTIKTIRNTEHSTAHYNYILSRTPYRTSWLI